MITKTILGGFLLRVSALCVMGRIRRAKPSPAIDSVAEKLLILGQC